jgi:tetratricopeptide (TPR) repeat protein
MLAEVFPSGKYETWAECRQLLPHSQKVLGYNQEEKEAALNRAKVAKNTGWYLFHMGEYAAAADFTRDAMLARERLLGVEHPDTLTSVSQLGSVLSRQGKYEEAEAMHRRALAGSEKALGPEHPNTLKSQRRNEEAISLMGACFQLRQRILGGYHPSTESSLETLNEWRMENTEIG